MIIPTQEKNGYIVAETIFVQDIDAYSKRDMERERSMVVGMMPPKIAQIMINMATKGDRDLQVWDAFCGLGTTMIEAWHAGYKKLIASDLSEAMVQATKTNMQKIDGVCTAFQKDARELDTYALLDQTVIVAE
jgi:tRNA G10  N-methylase Trm11